jgi:hypothetical protein
MVECVNPRERAGHSLPFSFRDPLNARLESNPKRSSATAALIVSTEVESDRHQCLHVMSVVVTISEDKTRIGIDRHANGYYFRHSRAIIKPL